MKSVLVIGGYGYLGRAVVAELNRIGVAHKVTTRRRKLPTDIELNFSALRGSPEPLNFSDFTHIVNCAGSTSGSFEHLYEANVEVPKILMRRLAEMEHAPRLTLIGSAAEIGPGHAQPTDENVSLMPTSDYGRTKAMMSELMREFASRGLDVNAARVFNIESDETDEKSLLGSIRNQLLSQSGSAIKIATVGHLDAIRDYLPLDAVAVRVLTVAFEGKTGDIYNVCSGKGISVRQLVEAKFNQNRNSQVIFREVHTKNSSKSPGVPYSVGNPSKMNSLLAKT